MVYKPLKDELSSLNYDGFLSYIGHDIYNNVDADLVFKLHSKLRQTNVSMLRSELGSAISSNL